MSVRGAARRVLVSALLAGVLGGLPAEAARSGAPAPRAAVVHPLDPLLEDVERRTFQWFWEVADSETGLVPDRHPTPSFSSVAAVGFGLTAWGIGAERGYVTRAAARARTLATLRLLRRAPQGPATAGTAGDHGFFYHFLDLRSGTRYRTNELSTVDTALLMLGVLFAESYFDRPEPAEAEIRRLAEELYLRVEWPWAQVRGPLISMGWTPERGFIADDWCCYNEGMFIYLLALGSPTHPIDPAAWAAWTASYARSFGTLYGQEHLTFGPLFGHQFAQAWIDLRGVQDAFMRAHGLDYFENSRRAAYSQRAYAIANPLGWAGYGADVWGLSACDGPGDVVREYGGALRTFRGYAARGVNLDPAHNYDDGTITPMASLASLPFAPEIVIPAVHALHERYGDAIYGPHGFADAFNPSFDGEPPTPQGRRVPGVGWVDGDRLGIDQGPILLMFENYRSGFVWSVMRRNPHLRRGLERAGFVGGWLR